MSADVVTRFSRACERMRAAASPPMNSGPEVQMGRRRHRVPGDIVGTIRRVRADHVKSGALAARADWEHARRGLHVVAPYEVLRVDPVALQERGEHLPHGIRPDRPRTRDLRAQLRKGDRGAARRARGGDLDLLDEVAALALRDRLDRAHQHVQDVHAHGDRVHLIAHPPSSLAGFVLPYPRWSAAATTASRCCASSVFGSPIAAARQYTVHAHSRSSACSTAAATLGAWVIAPWFAISVALFPSSESSTAAASSGVPKVSYGAIGTVPPSRSIP